MTKLIARDRRNNLVGKWEITQEIEAQLYDLKEKVELIGIPLSIPVILTVKDALNQKNEQDANSMKLTDKQLQDIALFNIICQDIEQLPDNDAIKLIIEK